MASAGETKLVGTEFQFPELPGSEKEHKELREAYIPVNYKLLVVEILMHYRI